MRQQQYSKAQQQQSQQAAATIHTDKSRDTDPLRLCAFAVKLTSAIF